MGSCDFRYWRLNFSSQPIAENRGARSRLPEYLNTVAT